MSKIHETAVAMHECLRVQALADARNTALLKRKQTDLDDNGTMIGVLADHAERVSSDAAHLIHAYEQELTAYVPETPADMLTQVLVLSDYFHSHELKDGNAAETVVRQLIGRLLEGLVGLAGRHSSPIYDDYFNQSHTWPARVAAVENPVILTSRKEPRREFAT